MTNKYLEKIAVYEDSGKYFKTMGKRYMNKKSIPAILAGAAAGVAYTNVKIDGDNKKLRAKGKPETDKRLPLFINAGLGGYTGHNINRMVKLKKIIGHLKSKKHEENFRRTWSKARDKHGASFSSTPHKPFDQHMKDFGTPGAKTKAEVHKHYKRQSMKLHPDRNDGKDMGMSELNKKYQDIKRHPGFNKLAQLILNR